MLHKNTEIVNVNKQKTGSNATLNRLQRQFVLRNEYLERIIYPTFISHPHSTIHVLLRFRNHQPVLYM